MFSPTPIDRKQNFRTCSPWQPRRHSFPYDFCNHLGHCGLADFRRVNRANRQNLLRSRRLQAAEHLCGNFQFNPLIVKCFDLCLVVLGKRVDLIADRATPICNDLKRVSLRHDIIDKVRRTWSQAGPNAIDDEKHPGNASSKSGLITILSEVSSFRCACYIMPFFSCQIPSDQLDDQSYKVPNFSSGVYPSLRTGGHHARVARSGCQSEVQ